MSDDVPVAAPAQSVKRSRVVIGLAVALGLPVMFWVIGALVTRGVLPFGLLHDWFNQFGLLLALAELGLGPLGIVILGRAAGLHGAAAWVGLLIIGLPIALVAWVASVLQLSGALGMPF